MPIWDFLSITAGTKWINNIGFWNGMVVPTWWVSAWFIHPSNDVSATTLSTLVRILMFDCAVQYCKLQRYMILVRFPCKILEIYLVRYMIDCEFVMIRGSFGGPFGCNQSRGGIDRKWIELRAWTPVKKKKKICLCLFVCLKNKLNSSLSLNSTIKWTRPKINGYLLGTPRLS